MPIRTSLLVGSLEQLTQQPFLVQGEGALIPQGNYYLVHATAGLSLLEQVALRAFQAAGITITATLGRNLRVRLHGAAGAWSLNWSSLTLRDLLGFAGNLAGSTTYVADNPSPLIWSPGWPTTRSVIDGVTGYPLEDEVTEVNADSTQVDSDYHNTQTHDEFAWDSVHHRRVRRPPSEPQGATWHEFRRRVLVPNHRWQFYEQVIEDPSSTTAIDPATALATYKRRVLPAGAQDRKIGNANSLWNLGLEAIHMPEYEVA